MSDREIQTTTVKATLPCSCGARNWWDCRCDSPVETWTVTAHDGPYPSPDDIAYIRAQYVHPVDLIYGPLAVQPHPVKEFPQGSRDLRV